MLVVVAWEHSSSLGTVVYAYEITLTSCFHLFALYLLFPGWFLCMERCVPGAMIRGFDRWGSDEAIVKVKLLSI